MGGSTPLAVFAWCGRTGALSHGPRTRSSRDHGRLVAEVPGAACFGHETYRFLWPKRSSEEDRPFGMLDALGTVHLPDWVDTELLKQLVSEQLVTVRN